MPDYTLALKTSELVAEGTMAFHLDKPAGFEFAAGQAIDVTLPGTAANANSRDTCHTFSIVSAPGEPELVFATRMRDSPFKQALGALPPGASLGVDGPFGSLVLEDELERAAVFIAGGIGITPFMSMLREAAQTQRAQDLLLVYSNRRPEDAAFLDELGALAGQNARMRLLATMTDMARSRRSWPGETRRIDAELVCNAVQDLATPIFYVAGPPRMVDAMWDVLDEAGVAEEDIRSEDFTGY